MIPTAAKGSNADLELPSNDATHIRLVNVDLPAPVVLVCHQQITHQ